ncbi:hypothetical protein QFC19_006287 [Naganishia cerealis]|uniref:Uncharacterized protein n=1 Tax=Naganishia cerealis TaxID=610337 RepID=A0ACC2VI90_9TREE|nr:hypothetical protein QFC19_006287 [Naganishia cerealis]
MTAVAPSPLPFTANLAHDSPRSSHPGIKNSPFRQHHHHHGSVAASSPASMRNGINGKPVFAGLSASSNASLATYGDGIKALLADPIEFEPYAKKVVTDETKYKPINSVQENGEMESLAQESAVAGVSSYRLCSLHVFRPISR